MTFAKLWGTGDDQILVKIDESEDEDSAIEVRVFFIPPGLGLCSFALKFQGEDDWDKAQKLFDKLDEQLVRKMCDSAIREMPVSFFGDK